mmetsp:Transcript_13815/g.41759  ORF Transcript_13815/g.41759 Transcript_13815/m.41759 type:complete len:463 (+) Transcript_13815:491-1879(+)
MTGSLAVESALSSVPPAEHDSTSSPPVPQLAPSMLGNGTTAATAKNSQPAVTSEQQTADQAQGQGGAENGEQRPGEPSREGVVGLAYAALKHKSKKTKLLESKSLVKKHWKLACEVHGGDAGARRAGVVPYQPGHDGKDGDFSLYVAYVGAVRTALEEPDVNVVGSHAWQRVEDIVNAGRAWSSMHIRNPELMLEIADADLEVLGKMEAVIAGLADEGLLDEDVIVDEPPALRQFHQADSNELPDRVHCGPPDGDDANRGGSQHRESETESGHDGEGGSAADDGSIQDRPTTNGSNDREGAAGYRGGGASQAAEAANNRANKAATEVVKEQGDDSVHGGKQAGPNIAAVIDAIHMTEDQTDAFLKEHAAVRETLAQVLEERKLLEAGVRRSSSDGPEGREMTKALKANKALEAHLICELLIWWTHTVLSAHGHARCDVSFFPFAPDPLLFGDYLAARQRSRE